MKLTKKNKKILMKYKKVFEALEKYDKTSVLSFPKKDNNWAFLFPLNLKIPFSLT